MKRSNSGILLALLENEPVSEEELSEVVKVCEKYGIILDKKSDITKEIRSRSRSIESIVNKDTNKYIEYIKEISLR
jgi:hypothetical protein